MTIKVSPDEVDPLTIRAWDHFRQLGFQPNTDGDVNPKVGGVNAAHALGKLGRFGGGVTGNRKDAVVHFEVSTDCFEPGT